MTVRWIRAAVPILLLLAGAGSIVFGARFHGRDVLAQVESKRATPLEMPGGPRPFWQQAADPQQGPQYVATILREGEPQLIKEVSVGGVRLAEDGTIRRTYKGFEMPSLCPT